MNIKMNKNILISFTEYNELLNAKKIVDNIIDERTILLKDK